MVKKIFFCIFAFTVCLQLYSQENNKFEGVQGWDDIEGKEFFVSVDKTSKIATQQGTKELPFNSIDEAFHFLSLQKKKYAKIKATINIKGSFATEYSYVITYPIKMVGLHSENYNDERESHINFGKNAGFVVISSFLSLQDIYITRRELANEPRTVPVLYSSYSTINLKNVKLYGKEGGTLCSFFDSYFSLSNTSITSKQNWYCTLIEAKNSKGSISSSHFDSSARSIIAFDFNNCEITIKDIKANLNSLYFAFFARVFDSSFTFQNSSFVAKGSGKAKEAIIYNDKSNVKTQGLKLEGFEKESSVKNGKLDYIK